MAAIFKQKTSEMFTLSVKKATNFLMLLFPDLPEAFLKTDWVLIINISS